MSDTAVLADLDFVLAASDIARLAHVRRPVVRMWAQRFGPAHEQPFPRPVALLARTAQYDAHDVVTWLINTQHGNNPDVARDVVLHARPRAGMHGDALTALLALRIATDAPLAALSEDDLLDAAEAADPDDELLFTEIEGLDESTVAMTRYVDAVVAAAFRPEEALDVLRSASPSRAATALSGDCAALVAELAIELAMTNPARYPHVLDFADPTGQAGDRLAHIVSLLRDGPDLRIATPDGGDASLRALRRQLFIVGAAREGLDVGDLGDFQVHRPTVHIAQYSASVETSPRAMLDSIDNIVLQLGDDQRAVVLAPASVLIDGRVAREVGAIRAGVLRSSRVRAIVRLPAGAVPAHPRQRMSIWVLGPAHPDIAPSERWTMVADVIDLGLSARADLVGDSAASLGDRETVAAHAFSVGRLLATTRLLAARGSLLDAAPARSAATTGLSAGSICERARELAASVSAPLPGTLDREMREAEGTAPLAAPLAELVADRHAVVRSGTRIAHDHIGDGDGFRVIGSEEVCGEIAVGTRRIDRSRLLQDHPHVRLTEPGDIVFVTSPHPRALVDAQGSSIVVAPARVLHIDGADPNGLVPELAALDVNQQPAYARDWRTWVMRRVGVGDRAGIRVTWARIDATRTELRSRLASLDELERLLADGVTAGLITTTEGTD